MSPQSIRLIGNLSSPNLLQTYNGKNQYINLTQSKMSKKKNQFKTETANFLKTQFNTLINNQLKEYRLQKKLQKQLQQFKKNKQQKQLVEDLHNIQKFRQKQSEQLRARFQQYQKQQQNKQTIIKQVIEKKKLLAKQKKQQHDKKIFKVRQKSMHSQAEDIQNRLSRVNSTNSRKSMKTKDKLETSRSRNVHLSVNQQKILSYQTKGEEQKRITNYLKKMKQAQSRIIEKQIKMQERKQNSIKSDIKNLKKERDQKQQTLMKQWQQKLETKMNQFYQKFTRSQLYNSTLMLNKSRIKDQLREKVIKNKKINDSYLVNKTLNYFMRTNANKENLYKNHQKNIDLLRTNSSFINNTIKTQKLQLQRQTQKNIKALYQKINKIKNLQPNETLTEKQRGDLLSLIDEDDPFYAEMAQFLSNTKTQFLRKKLQKEEQKAKADRIKKTSRFLNKN